MVIALAAAKGVVVARTDEPVIADRAVDVLDRTQRIDAAQRPDMFDELILARLAGADAIVVAGAELDLNLRVGAAKQRSLRRRVVQLQSCALVAR